MFLKVLLVLKYFVLPIGVCWTLVCRDRIVKGMLLVCSLLLHIRRFKFKLLMFIFVSCPLWYSLRQPEGLRGTFLGRTFFEPETLRCKKVFVDYSGVLEECNVGVWRANFEGFDFDL